MRAKIFKILAGCAGVLVATSVFASEASHEVHGGVNWQQDVLFPFINLAILLILLVVLLRKPAREFFESRARLLGADIEKTALEKKKIEAEYYSYERRLQHIQTEIHSIKNSLQQEGELVKQKLIQDSEKAAVRLQEFTEQLAENEFVKAKQRLKEEMARLVLENAERELKVRLGPADQARKITQTVEQLS